MWLLGMHFCLSLVVFPMTILAQSSSSYPSGASTRLSDTEMRGMGLFLQRCSVCHLPKGNSRRSANQFGPSLYGLFNEAKRNIEVAVREIILKGSPNMPGFQYSLKPVEIDDLIAYLKTLKEKPAIPQYGRSQGKIGDLVTWLNTLQVNSK